MKEKSYRSFVKGLTWRIVATADTFIITYVITGQIKFAISISFLEVFTKLALYYFHERTWNKTKFGRVTELPEYNI